MNWLQLIIAINNSHTSVYTFAAVAEMIYKHEMPIQKVCKLYNSSTKDGIKEEVSHLHETDTFI